MTEPTYPLGGRLPDVEVPRAPQRPEFCPGLPNSAGCGERREPGDRYCAGCRAEFDNTPSEGWGAG